MRFYKLLFWLTHIYAHINKSVSLVERQMADTFVQALLSQS